MHSLSLRFLLYVPNRRERYQSSYCKIRSVKAQTHARIEDPANERPLRKNLHPFIHRFIRIYIIFQDCFVEFISPHSKSFNMNNPSIISHLSVGATDETLPLMVEFYDALMNELGAKRQMVFAPDMSELDLSTFPSINEKGQCTVMAVAYGKSFPEFWIQPPENQKEATSGNGCHIAFRCKSQDHVDRTYEIAIQHGGTDNGKPGLRPEYDDKYYAAYFIDPCGNKLEAVFLDTGIGRKCITM